MILSPFSVQIDLSVAAEGAQGQTAIDMINGLGFKGLTLSEIASNLHDLLEPLQDPQSVCRTANRIYVQQGNEIKSEFNSIVSRDLYASAESVDFNYPVIAAGYINSWVNDQTHGLIQDLIAPDDISAATIMILVNCIYFKGKWLYTFDKGLTTPIPFYSIDHTITNVETMQITV